ncbi:energy-coupling factor transporter transmembrane component T [Lachnospira pectinoschiza]|uniref:Energy-coupling factor transport system permease protein n=1 Tax=Lachnospira pectinoschiza TaxID=28052 RepID=A0A1G9YV46_9FIRM|nr:energy-coupling factor transporter transmembrane component T [Lachnospira pectinoschiza]SDN12411.1 energy-coupling factor transport system permease protein [Lachnospira pectinoschiza]
MIRIDPRTKMILIAITLLFSMLIPTGIYTCLWILLIAILGILLGRWQKTVRTVIVFAVLWFISLYFLSLFSGTAYISLMVWLGLVFKCYPCCMMAGVVIGTTQMGEFMAAMSKWRIPRSVVIPLAIIFRYIPTLKEDWSHIRDAMAFRGISFSPLCFLKNPGTVIDALYLPVLVTACKSADELSSSAITRGIENPGKRTSRLHIKFGMADGVLLLVFLLAFVCILAINKGGSV